jgi:hypothetical protein
MKNSRMKLRKMDQIKRWRQRLNEQFKLMKNTARQGGNSLCKGNQSSSLPTDTDKHSKMVQLVVCDQWTKAYQSWLVGKSPTIKDDSRRSLLQLDSRRVKVIEYCNITRFDIQTNFVYSTHIFSYKCNRIRWKYQFCIY